MDVLLGFLRLTDWLLRGLLRLVWWLVKLPFRLHRQRLRKGGTHGSSRWATRWELLKNKALTGEGVILGRSAFWRFLRFSKDGMVMVFAATGSGKGLGIVIPNLLTYKGSMVVTDPKGENYAITRRRRSSFGKVRMLNPTDLAHSERYNPLDIIRAGTPNAVSYTHLTLPTSDLV